MSSAISEDIHIEGSGFDATPERDYIISSESEHYLVSEFIGEGCFGKVAKCINLKTAESTAIKLLEDSDDCTAEVEMLEELRALDPEKNNLVRFIDHFILQDVSCLSFEMLEMSLWDLVIKGRAPLSLNEIRPITQQLLVAFEALKGIGIIHADLKPDNVMFVNHKDQPYRVKLIDFGLARKASEVEVGMNMQSCGYRAPEVTLGLPISEAADMWGLGCVLAFLFFGRNLFPIESTYHMMQTICHLIGQPEDHLLNAGRNTCQYFIRKQGTTKPGWRLKTLKEYQDATGIHPQVSECFFGTVGNLEEAVDCYSEEGDFVWNKDRMAFAHLLKRLLNLDAEKRIIPGEALKHSFVTMAHLEEDMDSSLYAQCAFKLKNSLPMNDSNESNDVWSRTSNAELSFSESSCYDTGNDLTPSPFPVQKHDILSSNCGQYLVLDFIGEGGFGKVAKCVNLNTTETTAIKIHKDSEYQIAEVRILEELRALDPEKNNLVRFIDHFMFQSISCLAFEMLDKSLWDLLYEKQAPLSLNEIRPITHQLLVAFEALKGIGIIHADLKTDNVMLVNHQNQPYRVKLIDFGLAHKTSEVRVGMNMQPCGYRAPEVTLGLPISEAIDMWGLGCVLAFLFFGRNLFPIESTYHMMQTICHLIGQPEDHLLNAGRNTCQHFSRKQGTNNPGWRLKTLKEYQDATGIHPQVSECFFDTVGNLEEAVNCYSEEGDFVWNKDRMAFAHLLKRLLNLDAEKRITPGEALKHSFVTMAHLEEDMDSSLYAQCAFKLKNSLPMNDSNESNDVWSRTSNAELSFSESSCYDTGNDLTPSPFPVQKHDILSSNCGQYLVLDFIGEGGFGKVAKCVNLNTTETTAIKIHKDSEYQIAEVRILEELRALDPEKNNLVRFIDHFMFQSISCLAFEMLDKSLWDLLYEKQAPLSLNEIRPITHQLLVAFEALKGIGIIHADLKPDNVMFVNHQNQPYRVKLIDFGLARKASEVRVGMNMQPCGYRAPEVTLGLPISEAIDMWGLGCVLALLFFGRHLFPIESTYHMMQTICHLIGQPEDHLLNAGRNTCQHFSRKQGTNNPGWRLKTLKEYQDATGIHPQVSECFFDTVGNLEEAVDCYLKEGVFVVNEDRMAFVHFLNRLLNLDAEKRITPGEALKHSFVTMAHLEEDMDSSLYAQCAFKLKNSLPMNDSDESNDVWSRTSNAELTFSESSCYDTGNNLTPSPFPVQKHDILSSNSGQYLVLDFIGEGGFGKVAKCVDLNTTETTAMKIHKDSEDQIAEVRILEELRALDPEKNNLVRFIDHFMFQSISCLAFEMLDKSLWDLLYEKQAPLSLNEIRPITHQLLVAFEALKGIGIIHADLKPDNVMFVNHQIQPYRVKLIDFGLARKASEVRVGMNMQPCGYRAPEVTLGLPISEAIDMWGLGCVLAFLFFGRHLFPIESTYHMMQTICHLIGQPEDHLLNAGRNTCQHFSRKQGTNNPGWRLKTLKEYQDATGIHPQVSECFFDTVGNLEEAVDCYLKEGVFVVNEDRMAFAHLLKRLLNLDAEKRITPGEALKHSFVTMAHLEEDMDSSLYAQCAFKLKNSLPMNDSDESNDVWSRTSNAELTFSESSCYDTGNNLTPSPFPVQKHDILSSNSGQYLVLDFIGEGGFGKVAKCVDLNTTETTAMKIHKDSEDQIAEVRILEELRALDPEKNNLVRFIDHFMFQSISCLAFEMLDKSLWDLLYEKQAPLSLNEIRPITHQLLVAFEALKGIGIIHADLKPDNVMFVNHQIQPYRVKLIDLGLARKASEVRVGMNMQPCGYRAPEVTLGLPISEAIDMWGLGCVLAFLFFGRHLFPIESTYHMMQTICHLIGQPEDHLLNAGRNTCQHFSRKQGTNNPGWRLKTLKEYQDATGIHPQVSECFFDTVGNLEEAVDCYLKEGVFVVNEDRMAFVHFLNQLLNLDAEKRITPGEALKHSFVTMGHLEENMDTSFYAQCAFKLKNILPINDSGELGDFLIDDKNSTPAPFEE